MWRDKEEGKGRGEVLCSSSRQKDKQEENGILKISHRTLPLIRASLQARNICAYSWGYSGAEPPGQKVCNRSARLAFIPVVPGFPVLEAAL